MTVFLLAHSGSKFNRKQELSIVAYRTANVMVIQLPYGPYLVTGTISMFNFVTVIISSMFCGPLTPHFGALTMMI